jgi:hypothetical protein
MIPLIQCVHRGAMKGLLELHYMRSISRCTSNLLLIPLDSPLKYLLYFNTEARKFDWISRVWKLLIGYGPIQRLRLKQNAIIVLLV